MSIRVKVFPNARHAEVVQKSEKSYEVRVREKPIGGKANEAMLLALSQYLNIPRQNLKIIHGFTKRNKIIKVL